METIWYSVAGSPLGPLSVACSSRGVLCVYFGEQPVRGGQLSRLHWVQSPSGTREARQQLTEYFARKRSRFTVPLDLRGTQFQLAVWNALLAIPYGETRSYAQIASQIGHPRSFRAVGMANHSNPVSIIVPCHRVLASNGALCGYGGGLPAKQFLLDLERPEWRLS